MRTVDISLKERSYAVYIGGGLLAPSQPAFADPAGGKVLVLSNETVAPLYMDRLCRALDTEDVHTLVLADGESHKTLDNWSRVLDKLVQIRATRDATLVTLGGGVIGDIGGFAAASYMRGIRFIQVPTSLLAQVDASVGGKTGVNHPLGKNLVGAFHQPSAVVIDTDTLDTLPAREFAAGLAEVVKIAAVRDADFLDWLEKSHAAITARNPSTITRMIERSVINKAQVVAEDEREAGIRALLNFGHTFAHALETLTNYERYLHGEAVAIGMVAATRLSESRGLCERGFSARLGELLQRYGLPREIPASLDSGRILEAMKLDKKVLAGSIRLILVKSAGHGIIDDKSDARQILDAIEACKAG
ncbi:MAG: 3-dehydroquinate synthase [Lysobacterales bacterium]|jgi:3-dehydroquinate synthase